VEIIFDFFRLEVNEGADPGRPIATPLGAVRIEPCDNLLHTSTVEVFII